MRLFRIKYVTNALTLFTGVIFLNMSFIFAEISALKVDRDKEIARNLSILVASCAAEEEPGGTADEDSTVSEMDLIFSHSTHAVTVSTISHGIKYGVWTYGHPKLAEFEISTPPPEA